VVLAWLVLALSVVPAADALPARALVCTSAELGLAAPVAPPNEHAPRTRAAARGGAEPVASVSPAESARRAGPVPPLPRVGDARHLYLSNCRLLC
jgi:hypothetical protein